MQSILSGSMYSHAPNTGHPVWQIGQNFVLLSNVRISNIRFINRTSGFRIERLKSRQNSPDFRRWTCSKLVWNRFCTFMSYKTGLEPVLNRFGTTTGRFGNRTCFKNAENRTSGFRTSTVVWLIAHSHSHICTTFYSLYFGFLHNSCVLFVKCPASSTECRLSV